MSEGAELHTVDAEERDELADKQLTIITKAMKSENLWTVLWMVLRRVVFTKAHPVDGPPDNQT